MDAKSVKYKVGDTVKRTRRPDKILRDKIWTVTATREEDENLFGVYSILLDIPGDVKASKKWWTADYFTKVNKRSIPWL